MERKAEGAERILVKTGAANEAIREANYSLNSFRHLLGQVGSGNFTDDRGIEVATAKLLEYERMGILSVLASDAGSEKPIEAIQFESDGLFHVCIRLSGSYAYRFIGSDTMSARGAIVSSIEAINDSVDTVEDLYSQGASFMDRDTMYEILGMAMSAIES